MGLKRVEMKKVSVARQDRVAIVRLERGVTNAMDLDFVNKLSEVLGSVEQDPYTSSLVLSSANDKFFSIGLDIPNLFGLSRDDFQAFYRTFNLFCLNLYTFPKPTVAAITGHATAGGCILAICCDYRIIAQGRKFMGLNENKLGVPVPYLADCVLGDLVQETSAREIIETGEFYPPEETLRMRLVDKVVPLEEVVDASI